MTRITLLLLGLALAIASAVAAQDPGEHVVVQRGKAFEPGEIRARTGDRLVFTNQDDVVHNVFSRDPGATFNLMMQRPGETKEPVVLSQPGTVTVRCAVHPRMKLVVTVE